MTRDLSRIHRLRNFKSDEGELPPRAVAELSAKALQNNFKAISDLVPGQALLPMVKADAYGHGADWAAGVLNGLPHLYGFGVATLEEGAALRATLGLRARRTRIVVASGAVPWTEQKGQYCERHGLTPVIAGDEDWRAFVAQGWPERIPYEIKFNTGMNRIGLSPSMARNVIKSLQGLPTDAHPQGAFTHLAISETPESPLTQQQVERFAAIRKELSAAFPAAQFHMSNSGAIWNHKRLGIDGLTDVVRPGIALYGVPPWPGAPARGLQPVMTFKARVIALHQLRPGDSIGYGASFKVPVKGGEPVLAAILSAGYADGIQRMLSNQGHAWLAGAATRFLGIVSMDLSAVTATAATRIGDMAEILGPNVDPWAQARSAGTIPYELLTSLSPRVKRVYV